MSGAVPAGPTDDRFDLRIAREGGTWGYVPDEASAAMMTRIYGTAGNGAPLGDLFAGFGDEAAFNGSVVLNNALAGGYNPDAIAGALADALGTSEQRANVIARNEMLGAYRDAQLENFRANSDVLRGWMWSAADGCCVACAFMDGSMHTLDEDMDSHVGCRCSPLPATFSYDDLLGDLGIDVSDIADTSIDIGYEPMLTRLTRDPEGMRDLLGPSKFNAWARGDVDIADLVGVRDDGEWGLSIYEKSLKELGLDASDYLGADAAPDEEMLYRRTVTQQCMTCNKAMSGPWAGTPFDEQIQFSAGEGWSHGVCPDCHADFVREYFTARNPDATAEEIAQMVRERLATPALGSEEGAEIEQSIKWLNRQPKPKLREEPPQGE